jgi:tetratricopeptide (TPR) repeat protein
MQRGDDVMVSAELIDLRDNKQLWGEHYQRKMADLLTVQRDIAREITSNLRPRLSGEEKNRAARDYTRNAEAYQLYLRGRFYWNKRTPWDFYKAIGYFQQAIEKDPQYALAYSGLSDSYSLLIVYGGDQPKLWMPKAKEAAQKALALDDALAEAHASVGQTLVLYDFDLNGAERQYQRAIQLNPNYATVHQWRAENLSALGRGDEALAEARRALELDPFSMIMNRVYGDCLLNAGRTDEAIDQYKKSLDLDPNFHTTRFFLARAYEAKGMYDQAVVEYTKSAEMSGFRPEQIAEMNRAYARGGWRAYLEVAAAQMEERSQKGYTPPFVMAWVYARLGEKDRAFDYLEKAYQQRDFRVTLVKTSFEFDPLKSDPRYADLIKRVGLP